MTLAGVRDDDPPPGAMQAHGVATLWRCAGAAMDVARRAAPVAEPWRRVLVDREQERWASVA